MFFAYIANSMIARVDAAAYGVLLLDLLLRVQMIANPGKTLNSHPSPSPHLILIDTRNQTSPTVLGDFLSRLRAHVR